MTYCLGILGFMSLAWLVRRTERSLRIVQNADRFFFLPLPYLFYGIAFTALVPAGFRLMFENVSGPVLMAGLAWTGLYYGCHLEIREHARFAPKSFAFHLAEPIVVFAFLAAGGMAFVHAVYGEARFLHTIVLSALIGSISLMKRCRERNDFRHPLLGDLIPVRNLLPLIALCVYGCSLRGGTGATFPGLRLGGPVSILALHLAAGFVAGILLLMLLNGARSKDGMVMIFTGISALAGGLADAFFMSPILAGTIAGAYVINSTHTRMRVIEAVSTTHEYIEKMFMFTVGVLVVNSMPDVRSIRFALLGAVCIVVLRSLLKYAISYFWVEKLDGFRRGTTLLWTGLTGQGIMALGAAVEYRLRFPGMTAVFLLATATIVIQDVFTGVLVHSKR